MQQILEKSKFFYLQIMKTIASVLKSSYYVIRLVVFNVAKSETRKWGMIF